MKKNPANQDLLFKYQMEASQARNAAEEVALLAERSTTIASTGTPEEAAAARAQYAESMQNFARVQSATATPIDVAKLDKILTHMIEQSAQEKLATQKLAEGQAKEAAKSASPAPTPKKPSRYENIKAKMTKARGSVGSFFSSNKKTNPVRDPNLVSQQKAAIPTNQQRKVDSQKEAAKAVIGEMPKKWEEGLDKRTAAELFSPLAESITRLNAAINSPTATKDEITTKMAKVEKERDIYVNTLNARFTNEAAMEANREKAAGTRSELGIATPESKPAPQEYNVSSMALLKDSGGNVDAGRAQPNRIYISQDGQYLARDQNKIIHKGKLEGISVADLEGVRKNDPVIKAEVITKYNSVENQKSQSQAIRIQPDKQGKGLLTSFQTDMKTHLEKAKVPIVPVEPEAPTNTKPNKPPRNR